MVLCFGIQEDCLQQFNRVVFQDCPSLWEDVGVEEGRKKDISGAGDVVCLNGALVWRECGIQENLTLKKIIPTGKFKASE